MPKFVNAKFTNPEMAQAYFVLPYLIKSWKNFFLHPLHFDFKQKYEIINHRKNRETFIKLGTINKCFVKMNVKIKVQTL